MPNARLNRHPAFRRNQAEHNPCEAANRSAEAALAWGIVLHQLDRLGKTDEARAIRARIAD